MIDSFCPNKDPLVLRPMAVLVASDYLSSKTRDWESRCESAAVSAAGSKGSAAIFIGDIVFIAHYDVKCVKFMMQRVYFNVQRLHLTSHVYFNL